MVELANKFEDTNEVEEDEVEVELTEDTVTLELLINTKEFLLL